MAFNLVQVLPVRRLPLVAIGMESATPGPQGGVACRLGSSIIKTACWLPVRAPNKPHERLALPVADRVPDPTRNGTRPPALSNAGSIWTRSSKCCKWIVYGSDGLGGKGCTRMRPEVAPVRSWARFPSHCQWLHGPGIVRNLEGCAVPHRRSIRA